MPTETVHAQWIEENVFLLRDRFDFPLVMTQPHGVNGADLLPLSLIGCAAWDIVAILRKQRQPVRGFSVRAESTREAAPPWRFTQIHIRYRVHGRGLAPAQVQRAIDLTEQKYCAIYATLRQAVALTSSYEIVEEGDA